MQSWQAFLRRFFPAGFPSTFLAFDLETTGFSHRDDVVWQIGHVLVHDGKVTDRGAMTVNWFNEPSVDAHAIAKQIDKVVASMQAAGRTFRLSRDRIREGKPAKEVFGFYHDLFARMLRGGGWLVGHNASRFDENWLANMFRRILGVNDWGIGNRLIDTMGIERMLLYPDKPMVTPQPNENVRTYLQRIAGLAWPGVKLDSDCAQRYKFAERYGFDLKNAHEADADAQAIAWLMHEYAQKAAATTATGPAMPIPAAPGPASGPHEHLVDFPPAEMPMTRQVPISVTHAPPAPRRSQQQSSWR